MLKISAQAGREEEMAEKIFLFVRHELYFDLRFLESALSSFRFQKKEGLLAFATDGIFLYFSTEPLFRIFRKNSKFLNRAYLHTLLHCIFRHLWIAPFPAGKKEEESVQFWNIACDIAVEYTIDRMDAPSVKRILSWQRVRVYEQIEERNSGCSAAGIYRWLKEADLKYVKQLAEEFYTDDHRFWPKKEEGQKMAQSQAGQDWEQKARQAALGLSRMGDQAAEKEELFLSQVKAGGQRRSYQDFLRRFAVWREDMQLDPEEFELGYYSYGLRLYGNMPLIEPLETKVVQKIKEFVIVVDTSFSTSGTLVEGFLKETFSILSQKNIFFEKFTIRLLQCDNRIQKDDVIASMQEIERIAADFQIVGGGGSDFRPAFSYVEELRSRGELQQLGGLLYFTDGKGIYPKKMPSYRTAFLFLEDYDETLVPPWAMRLRVEPEGWMDEY